MDMDLSRENNEKKRQEEERMREAYRQLGRDLRKEHWERKRDEEAKRKTERTWEEKEEEEKQKKEFVERSYEKLQAEVKKYDDGMVAGWKEDIDTLLVFAGLFSAVVTAFLIESYQWLSEDTTVIILTQISLQLKGTSTQPAPFSPDASSIRINCFWFLSLIFSLTSALFGLLCKQWLREHQRDVPTRTVAENLALRQLRRDSFEKWGVASFLSALPILLEIALVFFFVGILDLLWTLQPIVFSICLAAISLSVGLYILTTILPTITMSRDQAQFIDTRDEYDNHHRDFGQLAYQFICPYKSPQAWAVYKLLTTLPRPLLCFPFINNFTQTRLRPLWDHIQAQTSSWSAFDLRVVRQFDQEVYARGSSLRLQVYQLQALQWAVTMFRDSPSMIPHLENILKTLPRSVALSAALDRWDIAMWERREWEIGEYLTEPPNRFTLLPKPFKSGLPLHSREGIELLFWHRLWNASLERYSSVVVYERDAFLSAFEKEISTGVHTLSKIYRFSIPFPLAIALWSHKEPPLRRLGLRLLRHFEEAWESSPGYDEEQHNRGQVAFANGLAEHINLPNSSSVLLTSRRGQEFIRFIHHEILSRQLYSPSRGDFRWYSWRNAIEKVQRVGELPHDYFASLPEDEDPPPSSELPQLEPIRYSIDTLHTPPDNPQNKDEERQPMSPGGNIEIQVHRNRGNAMSGVADLADGTLVPDEHGLKALNESSALRAENDADTSAVGTYPYHLQEPTPTSLSAGGDEPGVLRVVVSSDTATASPMRASEDAARNVGSPPEGPDERDGDKEECQGIVGTGGGTAPNSSRDRGRRRDRGRGSNMINDPNYLRMHWFRL